MDHHAAIAGNHTNGINRLSPSLGVQKLQLNIA